MNVLNIASVTVGMGATLSVGSDRYPYTIVSVENIGKKIYIGVQEDKADRVDGNGMSESQDYVFTPNPLASIKTFRLESSGRWVHVVKSETSGRWNLQRYGHLTVGSRDRYYDFSF